MLNLGEPGLAWAGDGMQDEKKEIARRDDRALIFFFLPMNEEKLISFAKYLSCS